MRERERENNLGLVPLCHQGNQAPCWVAIAFQSLDEHERDVRELEIEKGIDR